IDRIFPLEAFGSTRSFLTSYRTLCETMGRKRKSKRGLKCGKLTALVNTFLVAALQTANDSDSVFAAATGARRCANSLAGWSEAARLRASPTTRREGQRESK